MNKNRDKMAEIETKMGKFYQKLTQNRSFMTNDFDGQTKNTVQKSQKQGYFTPKDLLVVERVSLNTE